MEMLTKLVTRNKHIVVASSDMKDLDFSCFMEVFQGHPEASWKEIYSSETLRITKNGYFVLCIT